MAAQRADVGIGPYMTPANSCCPANFECKAFLPQSFKGNYYQIWCIVTGGAYISAPFLPHLFRQGGKDGAAGGTSETASTERVSAMREASYPLSPFPPFQTANALLVCGLGPASTERVPAMRGASYPLSTFPPLSSRTAPLGSPGMLEPHSCTDIKTAASEHSDAACAFIHPGTGTVPG